MDAAAGLRRIEGRSPTQKVPLMVNDMKLMQNSAAVHISVNHYMSIPKKKKKIGDKIMVY